MNVADARELIEDVIMTTCCVWKENSCKKVEFDGDIAIFTSCLNKLVPFTLKISNIAMNFNLVRLSVLSKAPFPGI